MADAFWEMGVGVKIKNRSFRFGTRKQTTFSGSEAAGQTTLSVTETSPTLSKLLLANDRVLLGPNTSGQTETALVSSTGSGTITVTSGITYAYASGDAVTFVGTKLAAAWDISASNATPVQINHASFDGVDDDYAQYITFGSEGYVRQTLSTIGGRSQFEASTVYRTGGWFGGGASSSHLMVSADAGANWFLNATLDSTFTEYPDTGTSPASPTTGYVMLYEDTGGASNIRMDCVYLEHAKLTDDAASGYYTFTELADYGSISVERIDTAQTLELADGYTALYDPSGNDGKNKRHIVRARFSTVPAAFTWNLNKLLDWQNKGNLLTLHLKTATSDWMDYYSTQTQAPMPPVLYGLMRLSGRTKDHYDLDRSTFDFEFQEVLT